VSGRRAVIVGAGFAGLYAAKGLSGESLEVVVVDRQNHHLFQPLLYQVATASLSGPDVATPIRRILRRQENARVLWAEATAIDLERRVLRLERGAIAWDWLVVATGATHSYFGHDEWAPHAPGLKTLADAGEIRTRILRAFEAAEREADDEARAPWLTFVVVGGGPTGVELAGAIADIARNTLGRDFRGFDPARARVLLAEGEQRVLPSYPPGLQQRAREQLEALGVTVRLGRRVSAVDGEGVAIGDERVAARTVLWAAGVAVSPLARALPGEHDRAGRVKVAADLSLPGHPELFVLGDAALVEQDGAPVPGVAPAAIQMGRHAARCIAADLAGRPRPRFRYVDKGSLATIGHAAAVAHFGRLRFGGLVAWLLWVFVHVWFLIGFRARLVVLFEWAWAWLTWQRVARVTPEPADARGRSPLPEARLEEPERRA
jgi:NADH dehydrogenase